MRTHLDNMTSCGSCVVVSLNFCCYSRLSACVSVARVRPRTSRASHPTLFCFISFMERNILYLIPILIPILYHAQVDISALEII
jgi:hypothetical protein